MAPKKLKVEQRVVVVDEGSGFFGEAGEIVAVVRNPRIAGYEYDVLLDCFAERGKVLAFFSDELIPAWVVEDDA